jgi:hypothetical protein
LPVPRVAGCGPGRPRARARMLLRPRPDGRSAPGPLAVPRLRCAPAWPATPHRGSPVRNPRSEEPMATRGTGGSTTPPPPRRRSCCKPRVLPMRGANSRISAWRGGGGQNRPAGPGRWRRSVRVPNGRPAVGCRCSRPSAASGGRQRGAPPRDALLGRTRRRSEGGARCAARATRPRPAGQNKTASRSEDKARGTRIRPPVGPANKTASSQWKKRTRPSGEIRRVPWRGLRFGHGPRRRAGWGAGRAGLHLMEGPAVGARDLAPDVRGRHLERRAAGAGDEDELVEPP